MKKDFASSSGNIFLVLFGAVAAIGLLGVSVSVFVKGPLQTAVKVTRQNSAQSQMNVAAQTAVMAAVNRANSGDCDTDGFVEPLEWRTPGAIAAPSGGGLIPNSMGINKIDPWGNEFGYCAWDHGATKLAAGCQQMTPGSNLRLEGTNAKLYPVVAIVSAGPDKVFSTTCRPFSTGATRADQNNNGVLTDTGDFPLVSKTDGSDDIIFSYTYEEATGAIISFPRK